MSIETSETTTTEPIKITRKDIARWASALGFSHSSNSLPGWLVSMYLEQNPGHMLVELPVSTRSPRGARTPSVASEVRLWASLEGRQVAPRGRIEQGVWAAYRDYLVAAEMPVPEEVTQKSSGFTSDSGEARKPRITLANPGKVREWAIVNELTTMTRGTIADSIISQYAVAHPGEEIYADPDSMVRAESLKCVRDWARGQGMDLPDKGRIQETILAAYRQTLETPEEVLAAPRVVQEARTAQDIVDSLMTRLGERGMLLSQQT